MVNKSEQLDKDDIDTSEDIEIKDDDVAVIEEPKVAETYSSAVTDDSVKIYLQQIGKIPLLDAEHELEVAKKIMESDGKEKEKTITKLVNANLSLIVSIAKK